MVAINNPHTIEIHHKSLSWYISKNKRNKWKVTRFQGMGSSFAKFEEEKNFLKFSRMEEYLNKQGFPKSDLVKALALLPLTEEEKLTQAKDQLKRKMKQTFDPKLK